MKTINFSAEVGVNEGYDSSNNHKQSKNIEELGVLFQNLQDEVQEETGIYISTVISGPNRTIYKNEWGCPNGGELTFNISGLANPQFVDDENEWKKASLLLMDKARTELKQSTISVVFNSQDGPDFYYLNSNEALNNYIQEIDNESKGLEF